MNRCHELEPLLAAHASEGLHGAEREELEAHLAECPRCVQERDALAEILELASLDAPSELERHALTALPGQVRAAWLAQERTRRSYFRYAVTGIAAIAAVALAVLSPVVRGHHFGAPVVAGGSTALADAESADLTVEAMADGPLELADDDSADSNFDPDVAAPLLSDSDEGEEP